MSEQQTQPTPLSEQVGSVLNDSFFQPDYNLPADSRENMARAHLLNVFAPLILFGLRNQVVINTPFTPDALVGQLIEKSERLNPDLRAQLLAKFGGDAGANINWQLEAVALAWQEDHPLNQLQTALKAELDPADLDELMRVQMSGIGRTS